GEGVLNFDAIRGAGIFKSADGGATWSRLATTATPDFYYVNDIVVSPNNGRRVYAATRSGVWRSVDGGLNWARALDPVVTGGCLDLVIRTATTGQPGLHAIFRSTVSGDPNTWAAQVRRTDANKLNTVLFSWTRDAFYSECGLGPGRFFNCPAQGFSIHNRVGFAQRFGWRGIAQFACYRAHLSTQCASMKLTLQIQLLPDQEQATKLKSTIERFNQACSWLAKQAFESKTANKITLQQKYYYDLRQKFDLSAQMAAICIRHVGGTYSRDKSILPVFHPNAAMPYDNRILSFKGVDRVSILTLEGRIKLPFLMGQYQRERFSLAKGQSDL